MEQFFPFQRLQFGGGMLDPVIGAGAAAVPTAFVPPTYFDKYVDQGSQTTYTSGSIAITAAPQSIDVLYLLIGFGAPAGGGQTVTSMTITPNVGSPVVATLLGKGSASSPEVAMYIAELPYNTTSFTAAAAMSAAAGGAGMGFGRMVNPSSATPHANVSANGGGSLNLGLNIPTGGGAFAVAISQASSATTWTITGLTERLDEDTDTSDNLLIADGGSAATPFAVTATPSAAAAIRGRAASWGP